jgi:hypothetical protein
MVSYEIDHVLPVSAGGTTVLENLAYACGGCNNQKRDAQEAIDPSTQQVAPLFHPRQQRWADHFCWSDDVLYLEGRTPTGKATIACLALNRVGLVNLRQLLKAAGLHPPSDFEETEEPNQ